MVQEVELGGGLAIGLSALGHHLVVTDLDGAKAKETATLIEGNCGSVEWAELDVCCDESVTAMIGSLSEPVNGLINNAGLQYVSRLEDFPQVKWDLLIDVMLNGACRVTRAVLPGMRKQGFGRIINIGSIHSLRRVTLQKRLCRCQIWSAWVFQDLGT